MAKWVGLQALDPEATVRGTVEVQEVLLYRSRRVTAGAARLYYPLSARWYSGEARCSLSAGRFLRGMPVAGQTWCGLGLGFGLGLRLGLGLALDLS